MEKNPQKIERRERARPRQIGRWTDTDWDRVRLAAAREGLCVAAWFRRLADRAYRRRR